MPEKTKQCCLLGYAGHGLVVAEAAMLLKMNLIAYADKSALTHNPYNLSYWGDEASMEFKGWAEEAVFILGIGNNLIRSKVGNYIRSKGFSCLSLIHPASSVSSFSEIGEGTFVARNAAINPFCKIGMDVIINTSASIDHECTIGAGSHIAPGAVLAGNVTVGEQAFIGANAVIKQGVKIENGAVVGAGSVVIKDVAQNKLVIGNPAKESNER
ncbi:MAG: acetyltransferase [Bacteroidia bacterium]